MQLAARYRYQPPYKLRRMCLQIIVIILSIALYIFCDNFDLPSPIWATRRKLLTLHMVLLLLLLYNYSLYFYSM